VEGLNRTGVRALPLVHARAGNRDAAIDVLKELEELSAREYVSSYEVALLHLALGDKDRAFAKLSKAYDDYSSFLPFLNVDSRLDEVRTDPRFLALVERMNFPTKV
jgi:tetratricopeptide (TPR) repeat protein